MEAPPLETLAAVWLVHHGVVIGDEVTAPVRDLVERMTAIFSPERLGFRPTTDCLAPACLLAASLGDIAGVHYALWEQCCREIAGRATHYSANQIIAACSRHGFEVEDAYDLCGVERILFEDLRAAVVRQATSTGRFELAKWLVASAGISADAIVLWGAAHGQLRIAQWAVRHAGGNASCDGDAPLHNAALGGHERVIRWLVEDCGVDVRARGYFCDDKALLVSTENGHLGVMRYLVQEAGADVNSVGGRKALRFAATRGDLPMVQFLVQEGADVHVRHGRLLGDCAARGNARVVQWLVEEGGMDEPRYTGRALAEGVRKRRHDVCGWLVRHILS